MPGRKQIWRRTDAEGQPLGDTIGMADEDLEGDQLLRTYMRDGELLEPMPELGAIRDHAQRQRAALPEGVRLLREAASYPVENSARLDALIAELRAR